jgi:gliding motility-associated-like protein
VCLHEKTEKVVVMDDYPDFEITSIANCTSNALTFEAKSNRLHIDNIQDFTWRFSDDRVFRDAGPIINRTFFDFAQLSLRLTIVDSNGCSRTINKPVPIVLGGPKARIIPDSIVACVGSAVLFPDSSFRNPNSEIIKWTWNFGNGRDTSFTKPGFQNVYDRAGIYDLKLTVEDKNGCIDSIILHRSVQVFEPKADFWFRDTIICTNTPLEILNESFGTGLKYLWDFGDGTTSTERIPVKAYQISGVFDVSLKITDTANCSNVLIKPGYMIVGGINAGFSVSDSFAACPPLLVSFTNKSIGAISYLWDFGNGNTSILPNPVQTYTVLGAYQAKLVVIGKGGCTDTASQRILIQGPTGEIEYAPLTGCPPLKVNFSSNTKNVKNYIWDFSDGTTIFSPDSVVTHTYLNPGNYRPRVIFEDGDNCRISIVGKEEIKVVGVRSLIKELPNYVFCDSAFVEFKDSSLTNDRIKTWRWDFGDGDTSNAPNPTHTYKKPGRYKASLFVETFDQCSSLYFLPNEIVVAESPDFAIFSDTSGCLPVEITFTTSKQKPDTTSLTWRWDFGNGTFSNLENPGKVIYQNPGRYSVKATVTDNYGCTQILGREVNTYQVPQVSIKIPAQTVFCDSGTLQFLPVINTIDPIREYRWDFGNGMGSNQQSPLIVYENPGRYNVSLEVETVNGCSNRYMLPNEIVVAASPDFAIFSDSSGCLPVEITFTTSKQKPDTTSITWRWDFGNGTFSTLENPGKVIYQNPGRYSVKASITDNYGCKQILGREIITYAVPEVSIKIPAQTVFCDSGTLQFLPVINTIDPIREYRWDFGNGMSSNQQSPLIVYKNPGRYNVSLEVETVNGCANTQRTQSPIIISESPRISMLKDSAFCTPNRVFISAEWLNQDTSKLGWVWNFGGNPDAANVDNKVPVPGFVWFRTPGKYTIRGTVKNEFGCASSASRIINVVDTPQLKITSPPFICLGQVVPLVVTGAQSYQWVPKEGLNCYDCSNPLASPTNSTMYKVKGVNQDGATCEREIGVSIQVVKPFNLTVSRGDTICIGESYSIRASGAQQYVWSPATGLSATNIPNPVARPEVSTNYVLIASDTFNCFKQTVTVPVIVYPKPQVEILERTITGNIGSRFSVQTNFSNVTRWRWTPSTGLSCTNCPNPDVFILQNSMKYRVQVTNPGGCEDSDEFSVEPICNADMVFLPNTFSPNADGKNDIFYPMSNGSLIVSSIRVFNRWGQLVFERRNFSTNDPTAGWNGTFQGTKLPPDVFVYTAELPCSGNQKLELRGNITLLR